MVGVEAPSGLASALVLFDAGAFYEAHEALEALWLPATGTDREVLHALLQVAVGFHHAQQGNAHGAGVLLGRALDRLDRCPGTAWNIDLSELSEAASAFRVLVLDGRLPDAVAAGFPRLAPPG